jgi:hypothetical protein
MDRGRLLAQGPATDLADSFLGARYRLVTSEPRHPALAETLLAERAEVLRRGDDDRHPQALTLRLNGGHESAPAVLSAIIRRGVPVARFELVPLVLADLIESVMAAQTTRGSAA